MIELFPDQQELLGRVVAAYARGRRAPLLVLATGGGKTIISGKLMQQAHDKGGRGLVLAHREELIRQFFSTLSNTGLAGHVGVIKAGAPEEAWHRHHLASVQTLTRRLDKTRIKPTFIVIDEAHHAQAKTYRRILERFDVPLLGLTATPERTDGSGLGEIFDEIVEGPSMRELIQKGRLSPYQAKSLDVGIEGGDARVAGGDYRGDDLAAEIMRGRAMANITDVIAEHCAGRRWIAFGPNIETSKKLQARLHERGISAMHLDGKTPRTLRRNTLDRFAAGKLDGLCVVDLISEGFDCPAADTAVMYRRTKSVIVYLQQVGRVLRYEPGKVALILDCCGNILDEHHGLPCERRLWNLSGERRNKKTKRQAPVPLIICEGCRLTMPAALEVCPNCHTRQTPKQEMPTPEVNIRLVNVTTPYGKEIQLELHRKANGSFEGKSLRSAVARAYRESGQSGLEEIRQSCGFKPGWVTMQLGWLNNRKRMR